MAHANCRWNVILALWNSCSPQRMCVTVLGPPRSTRATASLAARSITLSESSSVLATHAVAPSGATAMPRGLSLDRDAGDHELGRGAEPVREHVPASSSGVRASSASSFSTSMTATRSVPALVATAVFPSGVNATSVTSAK